MYTQLCVSFVSGKKPICVCCFWLLYHFIYFLFYWTLQDFGQAKRALYTTLVILGTFLVCWLPNLALQIVYQLLQTTGQMGSNRVMNKAIMWSYVLLLLNSLLDPIIYMSHLRMKLTALCHFIFYKITNQYDRVHLEEARRQEIVTSHTMSTMRSSVQMSAVCSGDAGCWLVAERGGNSTNPNICSSARLSPNTKTNPLIHIKKHKHDLEQPDYLGIPITALKTRDGTTSLGAKV